MISGRGFIHSWTYLYRNESPSLVAIFVIALFCLLLKEIPEYIWIVNVIFLLMITCATWPTWDLFPTCGKTIFKNNRLSTSQQPQTLQMSTSKIMNHAFISWKFTYIYKLSSDRTSQLKIVTIHIKWYKRH